MPHKISSEKNLKNLNSINQVGASPESYVKMVNPINKDHIVSNAFTIQAAVPLAKVLLYLYSIFIIIKLIYIDSYSNLSILC